MIFSLIVTIFSEKSTIFLSYLVSTHYRGVRPHQHESGVIAEQSYLHELEYRIHSLVLLNMSHSSELYHDIS
jgi:hypothetical protein